MRQYLWDFSFEALFLAEDGYLILEEANEGERLMIEELARYYEVIAEKCRNQTQLLDKQEIVDYLPELMRLDMVLQLCLIYSLGILENQLFTKNLAKQIENEAVDYFYEYRCFGKQYHFEQYSLMNQMVHA